MLSPRLGPEGIFRKDGSALLDNVAEKALIFPRIGPIEAIGNDDNRSPLPFQSSRMNARIDAPSASADQGNSPLSQVHSQGFGSIQSVRAGLSRTDHGQGITVCLQRPLTKENQRRLSDEGQPARIVIIPQGNGTNAIKGKLPGNSSQLKTLRSSISLSKEVVENLNRRRRSSSHGAFQAALADR